MGANASTLEKLQPLLVRLGGSVAIDEDLFWRQLFLSSGALLTSLPPVDIETAVSIHCNNLLLHNPRTDNFQRMILHAVSLLQDAESGVNCRSAANAMYIVRVTLKQITRQRPPLPTLAMLFSFPPTLKVSVGIQRPVGFLPVMRLLMDYTLKTIADVNIKESSQALLYESMQLLCVCASSLLYCSSARSPVGTQPFIDILHSQAQHRAGAVVQKLLKVFIERPVTPTASSSGIDSEGFWVPSPSEESSAYKLAKSAAATLLWVPSWSYSFMTPRTAPSPSSLPLPSPSPLADTALLLLLQLLYLPDDPPSSVNAFKASLIQLQNNAYNLNLGGRRTNGGASSPSLASVHFGQLYDALCMNLVDEPATLLTYSLLHGCRQFQDFVLSRTDIETLVQPILCLLYNCSKDAPSHMYMLQILILILSQDTAFSQNIHKVPLSGADWFKERQIGAISLGSLTALVLLRTVSNNFNANARDLLLPTNALAALANMAPHIAGLHSVAAQKLVLLLQSLGRLHLKEQRTLELQAELETSTGGESSPVSSAAPELVLVEEFLRIVLEILNAVMTGGLQRNTELLYALLHKQELLTPMSSNPRLADLVNNLQVVVDWFNQRIDDCRAKESASDWTVERVQKVVASSAQFWRGNDKLKSFPELRFVYEEEGHSEDFFTPYVWSIIVPRTTVPWDVEAIQLYSLPASSQLENGGKSPRPSAGGRLSIDGEAGQKA